MSGEPSAGAAVVVRVEEEVTSMGKWIDRIWDSVTFWRSIAIVTAAAMILLKLAS